MIVVFVEMHFPLAPFCLVFIWHLLFVFYILSTIAEKHAVLIPIRQSHTSFVVCGVEFFKYSLVFIACNTHFMFSMYQWLNTFGHFFFFLSKLLSLKFERLKPDQRLNAHNVAKWINSVPEFSHSIDWPNGDCLLFGFNILCRLASFYSMTL